MRMLFRGRDSGAIGPLVGVFAVLVIVVVVGIGVIWSHVVHVVTAKPGSAVDARLTVDLTPANGSTDVRVSIDAADSAKHLPDPLELTFTRYDSGRATGGGPALTGAPLTYSGVQAGSGAKIQAATGAPGFSVDLPTDGRHATISFRVGAVHGIHAVRPVPAASGVDFTHLVVDSASGAPTCQRPKQEVGVGYPDYVTCRVTGSGAVVDTDGDDLPADGVRNSVRLVLP